MTTSTKDEELDAIFRFDPFAEESEQADGGGDAGSQQADAEEPEKQKGDKPAEGDKPAAKPEEGASAPEGDGEPAKPDKSRGPAEDEEKAALKEQLRQANEAIRSVRGELDELKKGKEKDDDKGKPAQPSSAELPDYSFQIPQDITDGLVAEDAQTRAQAIGKLVRGIGIEVHSRIREEMDAKLEQYQKTASEAAAHTQQTSLADSIRKDYFGTYKHHDSDVMRPLVQRKATEVFNEWNVQTWTAKVRDEIAKRVDAEARNAGFRRDDDSDPAPQGKPNGKQPPHQRRQGARPGSSGPTGPNSEADISQTLFG